MPRLDSTAEATIQRFAQGMGLSAQAADDGSFGFIFHQAGRLALQGDERGDHVLVSLTRPVMLDDLVPLARLAAMGGHDPSGQGLFQTGINRHGQPVLALALSARGFDLPSLERAVNSLRQRCEAFGL